MVLLSVCLLLGSVLGLCACSKTEKERTRYEIVAEYRPDDLALAGTVKVDFYNDSEAEIDCLKFQLYPNGYREHSMLSPIGYDVAMEAYYAGQSFGEITISSVLGASRYEVGGEDKNILYAYLEKPVLPQGRVVLDVGFTTRLAKVNHRLGVTKRSVNFSGAFPVLCGLEEGTFFECAPCDIGTPAFADCADYSLKLTLPKDYLLSAPGKVEEVGLESKKRHTVSLLNARELAFCASEEYRVSEGQTGKTQVRFYHFGEEKAESAVRLAERAIELFSSAFGEYPYDTFVFARTGATELVFDQVGHCMLSQRATGTEFTTALLAGIAAQWWYAGVGVNRVLHPWQVDGLTAYAVALFYEKYPEYGCTGKDFVAQARGNYQTYKDTYGKAFGWVDARIDRPLNDFINDYEYKAVARDKALAMFDELEKGIGRKKMLAGLRKYYAENLYATSSPASLAGAFERIGVNASGFFDGYLSGKGTF